MFTADRRGERRGRAVGRSVGHTFAWLAVLSLLSPVEALAVRGVVVRSRRMYLRVREPAPRRAGPGGRMSLTRGAVTLREVLNVHQRGAQAFAQLVDVRPAFRDGEFFGWRMVGYAGPGPIEPGDIVFRVNDRRIERPEEVMRVWSAITTRSALTIDLVRKERWIRFHYRILSGHGSSARAKPARRLTKAR